MWNIKVVLWNSAEIMEIEKISSMKNISKTQARVNHDQLMKQFIQDSLQKCSGEKDHRCCLFNSFGTTCQSKLWYKSQVFTLISFFCIISCVRGAMPV